MKTDLPHCQPLLSRSYYFVLLKQKRKKRDMIFLISDVITIIFPDRKGKKNARRTKWIAIDIEKNVYRQELKGVCWDVPRTCLLHLSISKDGFSNRE